MRLPGITTRWLMVVAAVVAVFATVSKLAWQSVTYWNLAARHRRLAIEHRDVATLFEAVAQRSTPPSTVATPTVTLDLPSDPKQIMAEEWSGNPARYSFRQSLSASDLRETQREVQEAVKMAERARQARERDRRELGLARPMADYHARLSEKYRRAALRPWHPVSPDPPPPQ